MVDVGFLIIMESHRWKLLFSVLPHTIGRLRLEVPMAADAQMTLYDLAENTCTIPMHTTSGGGPRFTSAMVSVLLTQLSTPKFGASDTPGPSFIVLPYLCNV